MQTRGNALHSQAQVHLSGGGGGGGEVTPQLISQTVTVDAPGLGPDGGCSRRGQDVCPAESLIIRDSVASRGPHVGGRGGPKSRPSGTILRALGGGGGGGLASGGCVNRDSREITSEKCAVKVRTTVKSEASHNDIHPSIANPPPLCAPYPRAPAGSPQIRSWNAWNWNGGWRVTDGGCG